MILRTYRCGVICYFCPIIPICSSFRTLNFTNSCHVRSLVTYSTSATNLANSNNRIMSDAKFIDIGANLQDPMFSGFYNGKKKHELDIHRY